MFRVFSLPVRTPCTTHRLMPQHRSAMFWRGIYPSAVGSIEAREGFDDERVCERGEERAEGRGDVEGQEVFQIFGNLRI